MITLWLYIPGCFGKETACLAGMAHMLSLFSRQAPIHELIRGSLLSGQVATTAGDFYSYYWY
jgi:hypothetical protein